MHAFDKENGSECPYMLDKNVHAKEKRLLLGRMRVRPSSLLCLGDGEVAL